MPSVNRKKAAVAQEGRAGRPVPPDQDTFINERQCVKALYKSSPRSPYVGLYVSTEMLEIFEVSLHLAELVS